MSWAAFEQLVGEAFRRRGFSVAENITGGPDGGCTRDEANGRGHQGTTKGKDHSLECRAGLRICHPRWRR
ncbi:MAG: restriction endonuclease [Terriglobia bacterium]